MCHTKVVIVNTEALKELASLVEEKDSNTRKDLLSTWVDQWVVSVEETQHVINKSILKSEEIDFVWYTVAQRCGEQLIDNQISENTTTNTSFTCSFLAIRSPNGKLKENTKGNKET
jgi:hypothetical protein